MFELAAFSTHQIVWGIIIILGIVVVFVIVRFLWQHVVKYLLHGCLVVIGIAAILLLLHYFKVF